MLESVKIRLFGASLLPTDCRKPALFRRACQAALGRKSGRAGELNLIFLTNRRIRTINRKYLSHDYVTDVIAFAYPPSGRTHDRRDPPFADVYVSVDQARKQARTLGHSLIKELLTLCAHGVLHVMGYDDHAPADRRRMFARQDKIVSALARR